MHSGHNAASRSRSTTETPSTDPRKRAARAVADALTAQRAVEQSSSSASPLPILEIEYTSPVLSAVPNMRPHENLNLVTASQVTKKAGIEHITADSSVDVQNVQIPPELFTMVGQMKDVFQNIVTCAFEVLTLEQKVSTAEAKLETATAEAEEDRVKLAKYPPFVEQSESSRRTAQTNFSAAKAALDEARTQCDSYSRRALYRIMQIAFLCTPSFSKQPDDSSTSSLGSLMADHLALKKQLSEIETAVTTAGTQRDAIINKLQDEVIKLSETTARDTTTHDLQDRLQRVEALLSRQAATDAVAARVSLMETQVTASGGLISLHDFDVLEGRVDDLYREQVATNVQRTHESGTKVKLEELQSLYHTLDTSIKVINDNIAKLHETFEDKQLGEPPINEKNLDMETKFVNMVQNFDKTNSDRYDLLAQQLRTLKDDSSSVSSPHPSLNQHTTEAAHVSGPQAPIPNMSDLKARIEALHRGVAQCAGSMTKLRADSEKDKANDRQRYEALAQVVNVNSDISKTYIHKVDALDHSLWNLNARFNNLTTEQMVQAMWRQFSTIYPHAAEAQVEFRRLRADREILNGMSKKVETATAAVTDWQDSLNQQKSTVENMATKANFEDLKGQLQAVEAMAEALKDQDSTRSGMLKALEIKTDAKCDADDFHTLQVNVTEVTQQFRDEMANLNDQLGTLRKTIAHNSATNRDVLERSWPDAVGAGRSSYTPEAHKTPSSTESGPRSVLGSQDSGSSDASTIHPADSIDQFPATTQPRGNTLLSGKPINNKSPAHIRSSDPPAADDTDDYLEIWRSKDSPDSSVQGSSGADAVRPSTTGRAKRKERWITQDDSADESWTPRPSASPSKKRPKNSVTRKTMR